MAYPQGQEDLEGLRLLAGQDFFDAMEKNSRNIAAG